MRRLVVTFLIGLMIPVAVQAGPFTVGTRKQVVRLNEKIHGCVLDYTRNHFHNRRIWSEALGSDRDLYVYLPPGYDGVTKYPVMIWMHGFIQDEKDFLDLVPYFDKAIACGQMPPMIIAAPDGSVAGRPSFIHAGGFYINTRAGRFEDYVICDVWNFLNANFPIRPEPEAHILAGASMGGFGAFNLAIKHRDQFKVVVGIMPPLNLRYLDCRGRYMGDFDASCFSLAERYRPHATVGCFFHVVHIHQDRLIDPLFGRNRQEVVRALARENPVEMLDAYGVKPGDLHMFIGYGGKDEFNLDAQAESFLHVARQRGFDPKVVSDPNGRHNSETGLKFMPEFAAWLTPLLKPYAPALTLCEPRLP